MKDAEHGKPMSMSQLCEQVTLWATTSRVLPLKLTSSCMSTPTMYLQQKRSGQLKL